MSHPTDDAPVVAPITDGPLTDGGATDDAAGDDSTVDDAAEELADVENESAGDGDEVVVSEDRREFDGPDPLTRGEVRSTPGRAAC